MAAVKKDKKQHKLKTFKFTNEDTELLNSNSHLLEAAAQLNLSAERKLYL